MSIVDVISRFSTGTYTVTRVAAGSFSSGRYTPGSSSSVGITASIQPVTGRDLQSLPEAQHSAEIRVIYTTTLLHTRAPNQDPDIITIDAESWEIVRVERWQAFGTTHYRAFAARIANP